MSALPLRDAGPEDAEAIVAIALGAWKPYFAWLRGRMGEDAFECFHSGWRDQKQSALTQAIDPDRPGRVVVAESDGEVVGFACYYLRPDAGWGELGNNAVRPGCRGRGIGPAMYEEVLSRMREAGLRHVRVETGADEFHRPARSAYEKCGFEEARNTIVYHRPL